MRMTQQTNLNLDLQDLEAYPPTKKLSRWMRTYPQEVVPMCDQVLKESVSSIVDRCGLLADVCFLPAA
jgi:DNA replication licensing factor MCM4